jgi:hypothetical protein
MSKGSQQHSTTSRDRTAGASAKSKQSTKSDANGVKAGAHEAAKPLLADNPGEFGVVPAESAEDDFFARGEAAHSSLPPAAMDLLAQEDLDDRPEAVPLTPAQLERRARLRRIVGGVVGAAALLTAVVGAKALAASPAKVTAAEGKLSVPHQVVASIALPPQEQPRAQDPAAAAPEQAPAAEKIAAAEQPNVVAEQPAAPAEQPAAAAEKVAAPEGTVDPAAKSGDPAAKEPAGAQARRLPVIDIEIPASTDPAVDQQWASAAKNLSSQDFKAADSAFAELGKRTDAATRETARLARAAWWKANGRQNEVKPVIADLAANATTPSVRQQARDLLLRAN